MTSAKLKQFGPAAIAVVIILVAGVSHGRWTNRWGLAKELDASVVNLPKLPLQIGDWKGENVTMNEEQKQQIALVGGIVSSVMRRYTNSRTGEILDLLVVCGPPGPIAAHTPQTCYAGSGFELEGAETPYQAKIGPNGEVAEFWRGDFRKSGRVTNTGLRIYWSWSPDGVWKADANPRVTYVSARALYKIYVVNQAILTGEPRESEPGPQFIRQIMPLLNQTVFGSSSTGTSTRSVASAE
jgi:hypothetical protein